MSSVQVIQVIRTTLTRRGEGTTADPVRLVTQYWLMDGNLLCEDDGQIESGLREQVRQLRALCTEAASELFLMNSSSGLIERLHQVLK